jgi:hypothetical protein
MIIALALAPLPLAMLDAKAYYHHTLSVDLPPRIEQVRARIAASVHPGARLMIEEGSATAWDGTFLPALLPAQTGVEQIGGPFPHTPLVHHRISFDGVSCLGTRFEDWDRAALAERLRFLRVRWIATSTPAAGEFVAGIPGVHGQWRIGPCAFWELDAMDALDEMGATYDAIRVAATAGDPPRVIPYHWVEGLHALDGNEIVPVLRYDDPVPYICIWRVRLSPVVIRY